MTRDGHVRVLPLHVANKIAAGEVVERPASVVKELVENAIDAGSKSIKITITQGGRKLIAVQDDGCGMTKDDAILCLERQATSKILDVDDIENIDTLGFRGEAIPSIASVSRFTLTTRRHDADEGTLLQVNAGLLAEIRAAGCPPGTLIEVRDLFCNVPARRKFLRAYTTEENHVKNIFTVHALAHPNIAFSLIVDGRELYRLAAADTLKERVTDLFGVDFEKSMLSLDHKSEKGVEIKGLIEKPNLFTPTRKEQYIFVNQRPASSNSIAYAMKEAYPRKQGDVKPAAIIFINLPPNQVDVNVHPTKREVRFRDNVAVKNALIDAISHALLPPAQSVNIQSVNRSIDQSVNDQSVNRSIGQSVNIQSVNIPVPVEIDLPIAVEENHSRPWKWFKYLAQSDSGYLLLETDSGIVTVNPLAARERIVYEKLKNAAQPAQTLLIPEIAQFSPVDFSRLCNAMDELTKMGFQLEKFGPSTFKIDAVPQLMSELSAQSVLTTIATDLATGGNKRGGAKWKDELIAKSIARSFSGTVLKLTPESATKLVEELCSTIMPYVCPQGKPVMIFTSTRELDRKFNR